MRQRVGDVGAAHNDAVDAPAEHACGNAEDDTDDRRAHCRDQCNEKGNAHSRSNSNENVVPLRIGTEEVLRPRGDTGIGEVGEHQVGVVKQRS